VTSRARRRLPELARRLRRFLFSPWTLVALGAVRALWEFRGYTIGLYEDDAAYVLAAVSIGTGSFRDLSLASPTPITNSFPGFPILLAPFAAGVAPQWDLLKWIPWGMSVLATAGCVLLARKGLKGFFLWTFLALVVFNPVRLSMSSRLMTENLFLLIFLAALIVFPRSPSPASGRSIGVLAGLMALAAVVRPEGFLLAGTTALALWYEGRRRAAGGVVLAATFAALATYARSWIWGRGAGMYEDAAGRNLALAGGDYGAFLRHVVDFSLSVVRSALYPSAPATASPDLFPPLALGALCAATWGVVLTARRAGRAGGTVILAVIFPLALTVVHWLWFTFDPRYTLIMIPPFLYFLMSAIQRVAVRRRHRWIGMTIAAALLTSVAAFSFRLPAPREDGAVPRRLLAWMNRHLPENAVVLSGARYLTRLWSGAPGVYFFDADDLDGFRRGLRSEGVTHILFHPRRILALPSFRDPSKNPARHHRRALAWTVANPDIFPPLHAVPEEGAALYAYREKPSFRLADDAFQSAQRAFLSGDIPGALQRVERSLNLDPSLASAHNLRGLLRAGGDVAPWDAIRDFQIGRASCRERVS
jgi:hypothetical protein